MAGSGNKNRIVYSAAALFAAVCILFGAIFSARVRADEDVEFLPTLFCNDEAWYKAEMYPLDRYFSTYYVPSSFFGRFEGVSITYNERFGTLLISYAKAQTKFISFNLNTDLALTNDSEEFYAMIYTKESERYVPLEAVCDALGFSYEYYKSVKFASTVARICDGSEKKSFAELLAPYDSGDTPDVTLPPDSPTVNPPAPSDAKTVFLTFDSLDWKELDTILQILAAHDAKATFFLSSDEQKSNPEALIKIAAAGHSIGLAFDVSKTDTGVKSSFCSQNETLMRYIKHESRSVRIYGSSDTSDAKKEAEDLEYVAWGWDVEVPGGYADNWVSVYHEIIAAAKENDLLIVRFYQRNVYRMLDDALSILEQAGDHTLRTINDATQNKR